ncbi:hypothetical protein HYPSUDRAFT_207402 [Hypholoma sublateritium FD-334 SS-4]|uniref:Uncharacterized protein n=1 Tax=Hypholoma sublateritium (strain FD-334 SS-4) TaxID=945553 RepID=A0A0D2NA30_HYPSF|nr:hypothetical protein HYPSUDRAFT_207402 [Hypholoma sublateritium FD-334 SS-4]
MNANPANPQQICNEQSGWVVDFFCEEGIEPITLNSDHTTGAGPSTGSGVAAAMLDIEQAQEGQRRHDGVASVSAAPTEQMGNGKRKAEDALDAPEASKRLRLEPSAQSIGDIASTQSAEASASNSGNFYQKSITEYRHVFASDETNGNEGLQSKDSTFMMFKHEQDGTLTRLHQENRRQSPELVSADRDHSVSTRGARVESTVCLLL